MAENFKSKNSNHTKDRTNIFEPDFNSAVKSISNTQEDSFTKNLYKYVDFISWARWNPDLFLDLITPETGGIRLDLDQRVFLRSTMRFVSVYGVFPRGYGKTFVELLSMYISCVLTPDLNISMSAQTRENASKLVSEKHREILKFYPLIANEIVTANISKDSVYIEFTSGSVITILMNGQASKGARRHRISIEESALLNNELFEDCLEPIVNIPRRTIGKKAIVNPEELNGSVSFYTTSGYRGSDEFERNIRMIDEMSELKGKLVIGSDWQLACYYGRGETKSQILDKKAKLSPTFFGMNYESKWCGASTGALVPINKLLGLRTLSNCELKNDGKSEYILGVDVARSMSKSNNQTSIAVLKIKRSKTEKIRQIQLVNLINLPNGLNFTAQAVEIKKVKSLYNAKAVIVDGNGLGTGMVDELLKETFDPKTGESLGCWNTINTEQEPELQDAETILYDFHAQGNNNEVIVNFIDMVESGKLQLLEKRSDSGYDVNDIEYYKSNVMPYIHTDFLIEEVANLRLKQTQSGKYTVEQLTKRVDKDRYSALAYGLWYIKNFEEVLNDVDYDFTGFVFLN